MIREKREKHYWARDEDDRLTFLVRSGATVREMVADLGRSTKGVKHRISTLGLNWAVRREATAEALAVEEPPDEPMNPFRDLEPWDLWSRANAAVGRDNMGDAT